MGESKLIYTANKQSQSTIRKDYLRWRKEKGIPERCDENGCDFYTAELVWVGKPLKLILDHINGVNSDNRRKNLRLLCPNCNSCLSTHGGGNKGRVTKSDGGFAIKRDRKLPTRDYTLVAESGTYRISGQSSSAFASRVIVVDSGGRYIISGSSPSGVVKNAYVVKNEND